MIVDFQYNQSEILVMFPNLILKNYNKLIALVRRAWSNPDLLHFVRGNIFHSIMSYHFLTSSISQLITIKFWAEFIAISFL